MWLPAGIGASAARTIGAAFIFHDERLPRRQANPIRSLTQVEMGRNRGIGRWRGVASY